MKNHTVHAAHTHTHFKAVLAAFALLLVFLACHAQNGSKSLYSAYDAQASGNVVIYQTDYYSVFPVDVCDTSKGAYLLTWYNGQEFTALVDSDTPRRAHLTCVFDACNGTSDLQSYELIDCIFE